MDDGILLRRKRLPVSVSFDVLMLLDAKGWMGALARHEPGTLTHVEFIDLRQCVIAATATIHFLGRVIRSHEW